MHRGPSADRIAGRYYVSKIESIHAKTVGRFLNGFDAAACEKELFL